MKKAFTMLELVFIIVVIGVLAAVMLPRMDRDHVSEARIDLLSKIRYTQHLALIDDKYDANNDKWFRNRWRIEFGDDNNISILSGTDTYALDVETKEDINSVNFNTKYNVNITLENDCANVKSIAFDHVGRPILSDATLDIKDFTTPYVQSQLLRNNQECTITISDVNNDTNESLRIHAETGYVEDLTK